MSVYKPSKSPRWHYDFVWQGRRYHGSTGCTSRRDADRFEANIRRTVALGDEAKPIITVDGAAVLYWNERGQFQRTARNTEYQLASLVKLLGAAVPLGDLTVREFDRYVARRRANRANASVNREVELARRVWRYAADRGFDVAPIPWGKLLLKEAGERVRELSADEEARLFAVLPANLKPVVEFALMCGQRKAEIITLLWSDCDLGEGRATFRVKGGGKHTIPLTPRMVALLANQPRVAPQVFTYECQRRAPARADRVKRAVGERYPFSGYGWMRQWKKALADAGIADFRFHDLRHTTGTRTLRATGNLKGVQKLLGHTQIATTSRYAHALEEDVRNMLSAAESRSIPGAGTVVPLSHSKKG